MRLRNNTRVCMSQPKLDKSQMAIVKVAIANAKDRLLSNEVVTERTRSRELKESFEKVLENIEKHKDED